MTALTDTQLVLLSAASQRDDGRILLPSRLRGSAATKVLDTLEAKGLIEPAQLQPPRLGPPIDGLTGYRISSAGLYALGLGDRADAPLLEASAEPKEPPLAARRAAGTGEAAPAYPKARERPLAPRQPRQSSKQGQLIALLSREEGASMRQGPVLALPRQRSSSWCSRRCASSLAKAQCRQPNPQSRIWIRRPSISSRHISIRSWSTPIASSSPPNLRKVCVMAIKQMEALRSLCPGRPSL